MISKNKKKQKIIIIILIIAVITMIISIIYIYTYIYICIYIYIYILYTRRGSGQVGQVPLPRLLGAKEDSGKVSARASESHPYLAQLHH